MKSNLLLFFICLITTTVFSQNVGIGTNNPNPSAALHIESTSKGFLPPRMTTGQRDLISSPVAGLFIFNTDASCLQYYKSSSWSNCLGEIQNDDFICPSLVVGGDYVLNYPLTPANTITINVLAKNFGPYILTSDTINGYSFYGSGTFVDVGITSVTLTATGTPLSLQTDNFTISKNNSNITCSASVEVLSLKPLYAALSDFQTNASTIASNIPPTQFSFSDGITGSIISDGGSDMFDGGNVLNTNFATSIPYSNNLVVSHTGFGTTGQYFTSKTSSIFLMSANLDAVTYFEITGNNGADGNGITNTVILTQSGYTAYIKRVNGAGDPSINHMIIVETNAFTSQTAAASTDDDQHRVSSLDTGGITRIYYLLFATTGGSNVDDTAMGNVFSSFLTNVVF